MKEYKKLIEKAEEFIKNEMNLLTKIDLRLKPNWFFFHLPCDFRDFLLPFELFEDFQKNEEIRDLLLDFMKWYELPLVFLYVKVDDYDYDYDFYFYAIVMFTRENEVVIEKIPFNCFNDIEKLPILVQILYFFQNIDKIYSGLYDRGLLKYII
jgi:hypothetical protein